MKGIWRFEDLVAWQLAEQLQTIVDRYSERPAIKRDVKFHGQLTDAAAGGPRNIAEGFGRFHHPEFARFGRIAQSSEQETLSHLYRARNKCYITPAEFEDGAHAARKALKAVNGLIRYLDSTPNFGKD
jgi:four helix bundle protein